MHRISIVPDRTGATIHVDEIRDHMVIDTREIRIDGPWEVDGHFTPSRARVTLKARWQALLSLWRWLRIRTSPGR